MKNLHVLFIVCVLFLNCSKHNEDVPTFSEADIPFAKADIVSEADNRDTVYLTGKRIVFINPYKHKGTLSLKGSMHNHTEHSAEIDGYPSDNPFFTAVKFRDSGGYDFYTFTDHNHVTPDPCAPGIIWMGKAVEDTKTSQHLCIYNLPVDYKYIDKGDNVNALIEYYHSVGAFVSYAHPDWEPMLANNGNEKISAIDNSDFVEIENGSGGSQRAFNLLLSKYQIYSFGVDDYHYNSSWENPDMYLNKCYIVAFAEAAEKKSIWKALLTGCFYASSGAEMNITCKNGMIEVVADKFSKIEFIGKNESDLSAGKILHSVDTNYRASYQITGNESYIWTLLTNADGKAFGQAFIVKNNF